MADAASQIPLLEDVVVGVGKLLAKAGPVLFGEKHLQTKARPRRWVAIPGDIGPAELAAQRRGANPRVFAWEEYNLHVHCLGRDETDALRMRMAFTTALKVVAGANFRIVGAQPMSTESGLTQDGYAIVGTYAIALPHFAVTFDDLEDATLPTTTIESTGLDDSQGTAGDGVLDTGES